MAVNKFLLKVRKTTVCLQEVIIVNHVQNLYILKKRKLIMTTLELRNNLHNIINKIDDDNLLQKFYELIFKKTQEKNGQLWNRLTIKEQEELLQSDIDSEEETNLISHLIIKEKHAKWL